jgi:hypothetical protein
MAFNAFAKLAHDPGPLFWNLAFDLLKRFHAGDEPSGARVMVRDDGDDEEEEEEEDDDGDDGDDDDNEGIDDMRGMMRRRRRMVMMIGTIMLIVSVLHHQGLLDVSGLLWSLAVLDSVDSMMMMMMMMMMMIMVMVMVMVMMMGTIMLIVAVLHHQRLLDVSGLLWSLAVLDSVDSTELLIWLVKQVMMMMMMMMMRRRRRRRRMRLMMMSTTATPMMMKITNGH